MNNIGKLIQLFVDIRELIHRLNVSVSDPNRIKYRRTFFLLYSHILYFAPFTFQKIRLSRIINSHFLKIFFRTAWVDRHLFFIWKFFLFFFSSSFFSWLCSTISKRHSAISHKPIECHGTWKLIKIISFELIRFSCWIILNDWLRLQWIPTSIFHIP